MYAVLKLHEIEVYYIIYGFGGKDMEYKIVLDSCGELTPEMKATGIFESVALSMQVGEETIVDDAGFDQADFLKK